MGFMTLEGEKPLERSLPCCQEAFGPRRGPAVKAESWLLAGRPSRGCAGSRHVWGTRFIPEARRGGLQQMVGRSLPIPKSVPWALCEEAGPRSLRGSFFSNVSGRARTWLRRVGS